MQKKSFYYDFNGIRFSPFINQIEASETRKKTKLSQIHCLFLLTLVEKAKTEVTFDELRQSVWLHEPEVDARLVRNIQSTKNHLVNDFNRIEVNADFIKPIAGKGYLFDAKVTEEVEDANIENLESVSTTEISDSSKKISISAIETSEEHQSPPNRKERLFGGHAAFIAVSSLLYGFLFWIALLLETAYQFDRFGAAALRLGLPTILWIAAASFCGLVLTERFARRQNIGSFFVGSAFFIGGAITLCLAMSYFLPSEAITLARIQTQPAFAAYLKNCLIYFLPLGVIFILMPFHFVRVRQSTILSSDKIAAPPQRGTINLRPAHLFGLWLLAIIYSIFSTFYLLDNLSTGQYHNLFVVLIFLRFFVYFGLGLICSIWFNSHYSSNSGAATVSQPPRNVTLSLKENRRLKLTLPLSGLILATAAVIIAAKYASASDEEQIKKAVENSQKYESLTLYENPASFKEEQLDRFWTAALDVKSNADRIRIREAVQKLNADGRHYGDETKCEQFEFQTIEINQDKNFAVVKTLEKWFIAVYFNDGTLQKNKTVGPYFVSYILRKIDGNWLIEKSSTARVNRPPPRLAEIETISTVKAGQQFFVKITGQDFEPEMIFIEVVGEGCPENKPCRVPNTALRENSKLTETALENVSLTLASGDFSVVAHNGDSPPSNFLQIKVP